MFDLLGPDSHHKPPQSIIDFHRELPESLEKFDVIQAEADYLLALNGNQGTLHADVRAFFEDAANLQYARKKAMPRRTSPPCGASRSTSSKPRQQRPKNPSKENVFSPSSIHPLSDSVKCR
ncbi:MAG: hypothetical protein HC845_08745 [Akkermansiaceae bacterium]|nr:hypothetical protein [Akkermansiaceae bacterium]